MPKDPRSTGSARGNAPIRRQGHTTDGNFGTDPQIKGKAQKPVRDLKVNR